MYSLSLDVARRLPLLKVPERVDVDGVLHPLDDLNVVDEVDVVVLRQNLAHPLADGLKKSTNYDIRSVRTKVKIEAQLLAEL